MSKYYSLYNNIKLRKGGRKIAKLSETQFVEKAKAFILNVCKDDEYTVDKIKNTNAANKIIAKLPRAVRQSYYDDKSTIHKDFKDIKPDWENFEISGSLRTVKGCPYIIMYAGGDWECPICIMVYHDGKQFRCYIPEKGNAYRKDVKRLFGNYDPKYDHKSETYTDEWKDGGKTIVSDDMYAFKQLVKDGILNKEKDLNKLRGLGRNIEFDTKQCIEDFSSRVEPISIKENLTIKYNKIKYNKLTMNTNSKRALYESIMKSVSKTVKKRLNENYNKLNVMDELIEPHLHPLLEYARVLGYLYAQCHLYEDNKYFDKCLRWLSESKNKDTMLSELDNGKYHTVVEELKEDTKMYNIPIYLTYDVKLTDIFPADGDYPNFEQDDCLDEFFYTLLEYSDSLRDRIRIALTEEV